MEIDKIYNIDCLVGMQQIPDKSVDAIICDLPYGVLNKSNPNAKWDSLIPFVPLWKQYERVIKDRGAIVLFAQGMFTAKLMTSNPKLWRYNLVWDKQRPVGFLNANRMPLRVHEDICIFYKRLPIYHPQMKKSTLHQRNHGRGKNINPTNRCYGTFKSTPVIIADEKFPLSIVSIPKGHSKEEWLHPTSKPVALLQYLIRTYTNEGELVLDNCMGSGTTAIAAMREHRHFIGFETDKKFFEIAENRIAKERQENNS